jgi:hypothetical protein
MFPAIAGSKEATVGVGKLLQTILLVQFCWEMSRK